MDRPFQFSMRTMLVTVSMFCFIAWLLAGRNLSILLRGIHDVDGGIGCAMFEGVLLGWVAKRPWIGVMAGASVALAFLMLYIMGATLIAPAHFTMPDN
jgi:hypothetical protein